MSETHAATGTAIELREAFDRAFAAAPAVATEKAESFLTVRVGGDPHAIALGEIAGLFADKKIVALPSRTAELLGIAGLRGDIVPVYSLRAFLGYAPAEEPMRWLLLAGREQGIAFAFDRFDGYAQILPSQLSSAPSKASRGYIRATATIAGARRSIISVHAVMDAIATRTGARNPLKEH